MPDPGDTLERALARSLGPWASYAEALVSALAPHGLTFVDLEASLRGGDGLPVTGGRMMLERQSPAAARALFEVLPVAPPRLADAFLEAAETHALPLITGWDTDTSEPRGKLYLNLSDASAEVRRQLTGATFGEALADTPAHVLGLNVFADGEEPKLYVQPDTLPDEAPAALRERVAASPEDVAGYVTSYDLTGGGLVPRAWFVGLRPLPPEEADWLPALPGWDDVAVAGAAPFHAGYITSVGFSTGGDRWTVYYKHPSYQGFNWRLDPVAVFRSPGGELGVYLEPDALAERAYGRIGGYALSYRIREGQPEPEDIDHLMDWVAGRVAAGELDPETPPRTTEPPPEPWHAIETR